MTNKKFFMDNICFSIFNRGIYLLISLLFILLIPEAVFADGGMMVWPPQIQLLQSAQNAIVAWNGEEEILIISNDIKGSDSATILRIIPLPSDPTSIEEGDFSSFSKITEIINKKGKVLGQYGDWGGIILPTSLGTEVMPPGVEITFHKNIGAHDVTVVKVNDLDYFLNWIKNFAISKNLEAKEISPEFKDGILDYLDRDIKYFVFDVIKKTEQQQSIKPLVYRFKSDYLFYPLKITAISEIGQTKYAEVNVFLILKGMIKEDAVKKINLFPAVDFDYYIELNKGDLRQVNPQLESLFESNSFVVLAYHWGNLSKLDNDLVIRNQDIHIPTIFDKIDHFFQFITFSIERILTPLLREFLNLIFWFIISPVIFIYLFLYLIEIIKKQLRQKVSNSILVNLIACVGSLIFSIGIFFIFLFLLSVISYIDYGFLLIYLIEVIICVVVLFLVTKFIIKLFKKYIFKKAGY